MRPLARSRVHIPRAEVDGCVKDCPKTLGGGGGGANARTLKLVKTIAENKNPNSTTIATINAKALTRFLFLFI